MSLDGEHDSVVTVSDFAGNRAAETMKMRLASSRHSALPFSGTLRRSVASMWGESPTDGTRTHGWRERMNA